MPIHPPHDDLKPDDSLSILHDQEEGSDFDEEGGSDFDEDQLGEGPRTILITGASGNIGRKLRAAWEDVYDLVLVDRVDDPDDEDVVAADLSEFDEEWMALFHGVDTVIHLAATPDEHSTWEELVGPNLDAASNVFHASALAGVERIIFASSNHAMGGYRELGDIAITVDLPARPGNPYGAAKLMAERMGKSLAGVFDLTLRRPPTRLGSARRESDRKPCPTSGTRNSGCPTPTWFACSPAPSRPTSATARSSWSTGCRGTTEAGGICSDSFESIGYDRRG